LDFVLHPLATKEETDLLSLTKKIENSIRAQTYTGFASDDDVSDGVGVPLSGGEAGVALN
jgi:hypothetical protein